MRVRIGALVVAVFVIVGFVWGKAAQSERGSLTGIVKDAAGAALPGVTVEVSGPTVATAVTDARGTFRFVNLLPGDYTIRATLSGLREPVSAGLAGKALGGGGSKAASIRLPVTWRAM